MYISEMLFKSMYNFYTDNTTYPEKFLELL